MYVFHYKYIKRNLADLLFTDIESFVYEIKRDDVYNDFYKDKMCLILVIIHKIQSFLILLIKKLLTKWKMN